MCGASTTITSTAKGAITNYIANPKERRVQLSGKSITGKWNSVILALDVHMW